MDPRTVQTKANIKKAFVRLSADQPIEQISVSNLCKAVGIPRQTFYYHYANWQELIDDILNDEVAIYNELLHSGTDDIVEAVRLHLKSMESYRGFHFRLEEAGYSILLVKKMTDCAYKAFSEKWMDTVSPERQREAEMNFSFAIAGFYHLILDTENKFDRDEVIDFVAKYLRYQRDLLSE